MKYRVRLVSQDEHIYEVDQSKKPTDLLDPEAVMENGKKISEDFGDYEVAQVEGPYE